MLSRSQRLGPPSTNTVTDLWNALLNASFRSDYIISRHAFYENEYHALSQLDFLEK